MPAETPTTDSFPRRSARTRRFTLGRPRSLTVAEDGSRVVFLRSPAGDDPVTALWVFDAATRQERLVADPGAILGGGEEHLSVAERARRERTREQAGGIVAYGTDPLATVAAFALGGRLFVADVVAGEVRELEVPGPVDDPRPDPTGRRVAYVRDGALRMVEVATGEDHLLAHDEDPDVTWGLAEFVAAEEMGRFRGFWWSPDGAAVAAARVDNRPVPVWHIANPAEPAEAPSTVRYPAAGTENAEVSLSVLNLDGSRADVDWDRDAFPYLVRIGWQEGESLTLTVQSRDQRRMSVLEAHPQTGATRPLHEEVDPIWVEVVDGVPAWLADGHHLVTTRDVEQTRHLMVGERLVTPVGLQVDRVVHVGQDVVFTATDEPTESHVWRWSPGGGLERLTDQPGVHDAASGGDVVAISWASLERPGTTIVIRRGSERLGTLRSNAADPGVEPRPAFLRAGPKELRTAVLYPSGHQAGTKLPVLMDPYGGPHAARVLAARDAWLSSQWFADQGFAVVVADGRGTPGRGPAWDKTVHLDLATPALEDQVEALLATAEEHPDLDLSRVGIRGWSFGGYLSALAVLRRPDVFHAAVVGAPVSDWRLYDTHYTERYLGHPDEHPEAYERSSLLPDAAKLERPMLIIHGLADDNVVVAHSLRLSQALLETGRPHAFLPLLGVTHMASQEVVAENLLLLQVGFLREALGVAG